VTADSTPSSWLLSNLDLIPRAGRALDVACGRGRHALFLAARGWTVRALDRDALSIDALRSDAARHGLTVQADVVDLEAGEVDLGREAYDLIVVVHYLHRPLFPALLRALAPGGYLLYETFTVDQARRGRPSNPDFLLRHGELRECLAPLAILRERDGPFEGRDVASVMARKA
jgi:SAM-dependent methyltransferase